MVELYSHHHLCDKRPEQILTPHLSLCQGTLGVSQPMDACIPCSFFTTQSSFCSSFHLPGLSLHPFGLCRSLEQFLQPLEIKVAAALTHVRLRPCSKSNSWIKKAWPWVSAVFWQPAGREKMVIQLIITQICSGIANQSGLGKQSSLWHQFFS